MTERKVIDAFRWILGIVAGTVMKNVIWNFLPRCIFINRQSLKLQNNHDDLWTKELFDIMKTSDTTKMVGLKLMVFNGLFE